MKKLMIPILLLVFGNVKSQSTRGTSNSIYLDTIHLISYWSIRNTKHTDIRVQDYSNHADFMLDSLDKSKIVSVKIVGDTVSIIKLMCTLLQQNIDKLSAATKILNRLDLENISKLKHDNNELYDAIIEYKKLQ